MNLSQEYRMAAMEELEDMEWFNWLPSDTVDFMTELFDVYFGASTGWRHDKEGLNEQCLALLFMSEITAEDL